MKGLFRKSLIGLSTLGSKLLPFFWVKFLLLHKQIGTEPIKPCLTWNLAWQRILCQAKFQVRHPQPENWNFDERETMDSLDKKNTPVACWMLLISLYWLFFYQILRANVSRHQKNSGKSPKICFHPYFHIFSPICSYNCVVVLLFS